MRNPEVAVGRDAGISSVMYQRFVNLRPTYSDRQVT